MSQLKTRIHESSASTWVTPVWVVERIGDGRIAGQPQSFGEVRIAMGTKRTAAPIEEVMSADWLAAGVDAPGYHVVDSGGQRVGALLVGSAEAKRSMPPFRIVVTPSENITAFLAALGAEKRAADLPTLDDLAHLVGHNMASCSWCEASKAWVFGQGLEMADLRQIVDAAYDERGANPSQREPMSAGDQSEGQPKPSSLEAVAEKVKQARGQVAEANEGVRAVGEDVQGLIGRSKIITGPYVHLVQVPDDFFPPQELTVEHGGEEVHYYRLANKSPAVTVSELRELWQRISAEWTA